MKLVKVGIILIAIVVFDFVLLPAAGVAHEGHQAQPRHPYPNKKFSLDRGATIYKMHCAVCHGQKGDGKGPAATSLKPRPTNFLDQMYMPMRSRVDHYKIIADGRPNTSMGPWKKNLSNDQIWDVISYIEHLFNHRWEANHQPMGTHHN